jgi:RNA polymerase sigma-70 factor (ECF subfamily)
VSRDETTSTEDTAPLEPVAADREDLGAARDGAHDAACRLVARHGPSMLRTAWRVLGRYGVADAEDVVQDALIAALTTPALPHGDVGAWLRAIAARKALDFLRRGRAARTVSDDGAVEPAIESVTDDVLDARASLARLSATDRAILTLLDLEGYTSAEVAEALGLTGVAVRLRASRARRKLRSLLERKGGSRRSGS